MKITAIFSALALSMLMLSNCKTSSTSAKTPTDRYASERSLYVADVNASIKGKEQMPVDSVFSNLKVLSGFPSKNLVYAMDKWGQALGVSCTYCHDSGDWASNIKPEKDIARQMVELGVMVNRELLKIKDLPSERPTVNCITCHRGQKIPALKMGGN
jgi:hypothetical protein